MTLKVLFELTEGRILGAQAVGGAGVDKRIDILAVAIQAGMSVFDLEEMELAYSPQYGSAKDPINMAGFVGAGLLRGDHPQVDVEVVLAESTHDRVILVDVRSREEFAAGTIAGAVNIPIDELRSRLGEFQSRREDRCFLPSGTERLFGHAHFTTGRVLGYEYRRRIPNVSAFQSNVQIGVPVEFTACQLRG